MEVLLALRFYPSSVAGTRGKKSGEKERHGRGQNLVNRVTARELRCNDPLLTFNKCLLEFPLWLRGNEPY